MSLQEHLLNNLHFLHKFEKLILPASKYFHKLRSISGLFILLHYFIHFILVPVFNFITYLEALIINLIY